ncbi:hypothetical protein BDP27DRAFT_1369814 [Rhodocollybia butyracea]|nr:hypothetical protein BDP27DRAFT_1369814 [Rhodocollybia butyracea]
MRFTVAYASVLLFASFSCILATPIAVNRDTLIQRRSESGLSVRATEIVSIEARGVGSSRLEQQKASLNLGKVAITDFVFTAMVAPHDSDFETVNAHVERVKRAVKTLIKTLIKCGLHGTGTQVKDFGLPDGGFEEIQPSSQVEFTFKLGGVSYNGILTDLSGQNAKKSGILYVGKHMVYPKPPMDSESDTNTCVTM